MPKDTFYNLPSEKKSRILEASKKAFCKTHYAKVTIDAIVDLANIPKGSFYQYFYNKDDLYEYLFLDLSEDKSDRFYEDIKNASDEGFSSLMVRLIETARQYETQDEMMINLKERFLKECPQELKEKLLKQMMPKSMELFEKVLRMYIEKGEFRSDLNVRQVSFMITSVIINLESYTTQDEYDHGAALKDMLDTLALGLRR